MKRGAALLAFDRQINVEPVSALMDTISPWAKAGK